MGLRSELSRVVLCTAGYGERGFGCVVERILSRCVLALLISLSSAIVAQVCVAGRSGYLLDAEVAHLVSYCAYSCMRLEHIARSLSFVIPFLPEVLELV